MNITKGSMKLTGSLPTGTNSIGIVDVPQTVVTLANAVAITDTAVKQYRLVAEGGLTAAQIRKYKKFKISLQDTHNQTATIFIMNYNAAFGDFSSAAVIYTAADITTGTDRILYQSKAGGTGAVSTVKVIAALEDVMSDLYIQVQFGTGPTSGALTIKVECQG